MPSLLARTRQLLRRFDLHARKGLGQHFLIDGSVLKKITTAAELSPDDIVIEVGPGLGILTSELCRQAGWVMAIELDSQLALVLKETLADCHNMTIINRDILEVEPGALLREHAASLPSPVNSLGYKVVANLPYYITSLVLRHFLEAAVKPRLMVVMVQKEIAQAITAGPGEMSILAVSVQFYGKPKIVSYVPARAFYPAPKVDSAILRVDLYPRPAVAVGDTRGFFALVKAGFSTPRKQIVNSLAQGLGRVKADVLPLLEKAGLDPQRRAETLSLEEWAELLRAYSEAKRAA